RRRDLLPDAVPGGPVDRAPDRPDRLPAPGAPARAGAAAVRPRHPPRFLLLRRERRRSVVATLALAAVPLSGQLHLALGAIPLALGYAWARLPRADRWQAASGIAVALVGGLLLHRLAVAGSIGTGRSFAQVDRYSAEVWDFVTRDVGSGIEELVFVGWLTPRVPIAGLIAVRRRRGLAVLLGLAALLPCLLALGANLPGYETLWRQVPGLGATRVPERFMPTARLALRGRVALWVG